jgi:antitoxin YefM
MTESMPFSEAKAHLSELAERVEREHERFLVTRNGRPSFALVSPDDLDALEETLDILRDPDLVASIARCRSEAEAGETLPPPSTGAAGPGVDHS